MKTLRLLFLGGLVIAVAGCAASRSTSPSLFLLNDDPDTAAAVESSALNRASTSGPGLTVAAVQTAPYLNQGGIVYQTAAHRVVVAANNRWASPLSGQLTDGLIAELTRDLETINVRSGNRSSGYELVTSVDSFLGHYDGSAHIGGRWVLLDSNGKEVSRDRFDRRVELSKDGYPALVSSLAEGWRQVADALAPQIARTVRVDQRRAPD